MNQTMDLERNELCVLDKNGDTKTIWDPDNEDEVRAAKDTFTFLKGKGYLIYRVAKSGDKGEVMHKFDSSAKRMIAVPAVVGG